MKYYLIAGEASGDLHGANLMKGIREHDPAAEFRFFGGDLMAAEGGTPDKHYAEMAFMGFVEVLANLRTIFRNMAQAKKAISDFKPDAVVLIDFPGFNLKIAAYAKSLGIPVFYYISPKVWAWNQKRVLKIKKVVDRMFCILPFEVDFYREWGMAVDYVGNPLMDAIAANIPDEQFRLHHQLDERPILALLPGSRKQELQRLLPEMLKAADAFPQYQAVIAGAPSFSAADYAAYLGSRSIPVVFNATYNLVLESKAALVTSGTATLETALLKTPQVVLYKGHGLSIAIARLLVKIRFISLVNLIMDAQVVRELIQEDCNPIKIAAELEQVLHNEPYRNTMLANYERLAERVGGPGASARAAELMVKALKNA